MPHSRIDCPTTWPASKSLPARGVRVLAVGLALAATWAWPAPADAQDAQRSVSVFVSNGAKLKRLGGSRSMLHVGVGMEWRHPRGLGLAIEGGPRFEDHEVTRLDDLLLSVNANYHMRARARGANVIPFLGGGYSLGVEPVSDGSQTSLISLAGGVTYWLNDHRGILLEIRDAVTLGQPQTGYHHLGVRVGYMWQLGRS